MRRNLIGADSEGFLKVFMKLEESFPVYYIILFMCVVRTCFGSVLQ